MLRPHVGEEYCSRCQTECGDDSTCRKCGDCGIINKVDGRTPTYQLVDMLLKKVFPDAVR